MPHTRQGEAHLETQINNFHQLDSMTQPSLSLHNVYHLTHDNTQTVVNVRHTPSHDQFEAVQLALFKNRTFFCYIKIAIVTVECPGQLRN